jgi:NADPH-dependent glutamate synthase beta subunit-like oxidoreductase
MDQQELRRLENLCIQDWAPWCTAACPVHVDVRAISAAIAEGDFQAAAQLLRRSVPFAGIISRICDHPCESVCKRREVGESIAIRTLERSALAYSRPQDVRTPAIPKKRQCVAIIGSGLSGLTAAFDLARKGYQVTVFEAADRLGGYLRHYPEAVLPRSVLGDDFEVLKKLPVDLRFGIRIGVHGSLPDLRQNYDAVYVGTGRASNQSLGIEIDESGSVSVDAVAFETNMHGIFAGGRAVYGLEYSPITSISHGRRAAISIDRFLQKVSLTASRENEGAYETSLFTSTKGIEKVLRIPMSDPARGYSSGEAREEAARCLHCECMECVKVCEYLAHYKGYPKKYIRQIYNNLSIVMGQRHGNKLINSCSLCGLCREVCPESLHMGEVCKAARSIMVDQGKMPPSAHEFALKDMEFSNSDKAALARHQPGVTSSAYLFFPGCQLSGSFPDHVKKAYAYLRDRLQGGVGLMLRCCGAPADWAGRAETFSQVLDAFRAKWMEMGSPQLILACSSCYAVFKAHLPEAHLVSLWEIFDQWGLPQTDPVIGQGVLAIHDPCTSRYEARIQESVRNIVRTLGMQIAELPLSRDKTECCGFGGLMYFANRELADKVVERRINETTMDLLVYCAVCCDHFRSGGKPTRHLLDLIFGETTTRDKPKSAPDYSQRRENRVRLKNFLLGELWSEKGLEHKDYQPITLRISDGVRELMAQRMILVEDVEQVIQWAESTGTKLVQKKTGHVLAHYRPGTVTYWVEYSVDEDGFTIHNAYSHRMEILEELRA